MSGLSARADLSWNMYQLRYLKWGLESASASQRSLICPEMIIEPSGPCYPVENLPFVPKTTDRLAETPALVIDSRGVQTGCTDVRSPTASSGDDYSGTPARPPAARSYTPDEEEKESRSDMSMSVLAEAARRLSSD
ncbi:hypothetical protein F444_19532 [Phytophthora nicotianae P1976]|uniref:Uncharacterized protein n=1 Tax=Phytophthora nicotianae P1976 TaxID=1317066 RepID=A0A080Z7F1_PHYNI|nr:hypothetical protein F444_19532 [Phytophthora nicotianae P1976]